MKEHKERESNSRIFITLWGFLMHVILLWGVMDANFHSPIVPGLPTHPMPIGSPAKRIIVFVADGLRYRTFKEHIPPYLNSVIQNHGVWGVSHTRMPTESRPGNIAIVAGLYEDPSAVFKGWKENPVDFDSVFNQSHASWLWGSPDIVPLFTKYSNTKIHGTSYPHSWQDFSDDAEARKRLDSWVFDQYWDWLKHNALNYKTEDKILLYFHLLGCDTTGHAVKPQSNEYVEAMMTVDHNIEKVIKETEEFFGDNSTAYIFTSDHGMTDWGSHGSGSTDETETPFVAWGAGVTKNSNLHNIEQADITPLISTLVGISIPVNNEGILPYELLDSKYEEFIANAFLTNAKQLGEQIKANRELTVGRSLVNMYWKDKEFNEKLVEAEKLLQGEDFKSVIDKVKYITNVAKETLNYYRHYQTDRFLFCLMIMWIGWIIFLFVDLSGVPRQTIRLGCYDWIIFSNFALVVALIPLIIEYSVAGCKEWRLLGYGVICEISIWIMARKIIKKGPRQLETNSKRPSIEFIGIIFITLMMYVGLMYRWTFSIGMLLVVGLQKLIFDRNASSHLLMSGTALAVFPFLPTVGPQPRTYLVLFALGISVIFIVKKQKIYKYNKIIEILRIILTALCLCIIDGRSFLSWLLLISTPIVISLYPKEWNLRIFGVTMALLSPLALLSASYEPIFFLIFATHLQNWPIYEYLQNFTPKARMNLRHFSTAAFLMLYTLISFFGTGNMASISSFDPKWTRHFLTVYSPFTMTILILLKFVIPQILVGCLIRALAPDSTIFSAVLLLGDCLAIPLMYSVTTEGSWLDIGSAISRFVIAIVLPILLLVVYYLTKPFTTFSLQEFIRRKSIKSQRLKI